MYSSKGINPLELAKGSSLPFSYESGWIAGVAAAVAAVLGGVFFILDYRSKEGGGYLFQLIGFLSPAVLLLIIGLYISGSVLDDCDGLAGTTGDRSPRRRTPWLRRDSGALARRRNRGRTF